MRDIQVVAFRDVTTFGTTVYIKDNLTQKLYRPDGQWVSVSPGATPPYEAGWHIPEWAEDSFMAALNASLGGVESPIHLRADYVSERERVDNLIKVLSDGLRWNSGL